MFVDDHNEMCHGLPDALTVRISPEELRSLKEGEVVQGKNNGRGITVLLMVEKDPQPASFS